VRFPVGSSGATLYHFSSISSGGAATLGRGPANALPRRSFGRNARRGLLGDFSLVTDLGAGIGSLQWFRGFATCGALCYAAFWFAPGLDAIPGASAAPLNHARQKEARAFSITPLARGADTGRRMAATEAVRPLLDRPERPSLKLIATIGEGDGLLSALERAGVASAEAEKAAELIGGIVPVDEIRPGTAIDITLGRRANRRTFRPLDALSLRARFDLRLSLKRNRGKLVVTSQAIAVDETPLRIQGAVGFSLYRSARAAGVPAKVVENYIKAIASQIDVSDMDSSDRFDIIIEHRRAETGETEMGGLMFAGLDRGRGKDLRLLPWEQDGRTQWFEASGVGKQNGLLQRPVAGAVSSSFGLRLHPILGYFRMHKGQDFRAAAGTPILAATDGRIVAAGRAGGYGNQVRIAHAGGLMTSYSHMSRIATRVGEAVRQGEVIGYVGSTGLSTGPHLHYELYRNGVQVNPASVKYITRAQLSGAELAAFKAKLKSLMSVRTGGPSRIADAAGGKKSKA
jgi:murein DD-endopeptidase MepM/ murein hydrolase activator NlpD